MFFVCYIYFLEVNMINYLSKNGERLFSTITLYVCSLLYISLCFWSSLCVLSFSNLFGEKEKIAREVIILLHTSINTSLFLLFGVGGGH